MRRWYFLRRFFALLVTLPWLWVQGKQLLYTKRWYLHLSRSITGIISMYCSLYVISQLPLAQAMVVLLMSPFIVPLIAKFFVKRNGQPPDLIQHSTGFWWCTAGFAYCYRRWCFLPVFNSFIVSRVSGRHQNYYSLYVRHLNPQPV